MSVILDIMSSLLYVPDVKNLQHRGDVMTDEQADPAEDDPVSMTMDERTVWVYLVTVVVTSGAYLAVVLPRLATQPVAQISWVRPMLWTLGLSMLGTVLGTIVAAVVGAAGQRRRGSEVCAELGSDVRDQEIAGFGARASVGVLGAGLAAALVLAMLDLDTFWIGNLLFLVGVVGAIVETSIKIRLYRRGF